MRVALVAASVAMVLGVLLAQPPSTVASTPACDRQLIMQIDSAKISVEPDGFSIDAFGISESAGWSSQTLIVTSVKGDTAHVDFVGCRPEVSAMVLTPIQSSTMLDLPLDTRKIVIRAKTNTMTVEISGQ